MKDFEAAWIQGSEESFQSKLGTWLGIVQPKWELNHIGQNSQESQHVNARFLLTCAIRYFFPWLCKKANLTSWICFFFSFAAWKPQQFYSYLQFFACANLTLLRRQMQPMSRRTSLSSKSGWSLFPAVVRPMTLSAPARRWTWRSRSWTLRYSTPRTASHRYRGVTVLCAAPRKHQVSWLVFFLASLKRLLRHSWGIIFFSWKCTAHSGGYLITFVF